MAGLAPIEGIVVGAHGFGEANRVVTLLSAELGRIALVVYRARAAKSGWPPLLQVGNRLRVQRRRGRGELDVAQSADLLAGPKVARHDVDRLALLAYGCELCAALAPTAHPAPRLARLLEVLGEVLEAPQEGPPGEGVRVALEAKALTFAGLAPRLVQCARCGGRIDDPAAFDPESGGAVHARCGLGRHVDATSLLRIEALRRTPLAQLWSDHAGAHPWLLADFAQHHLRRALRSREVLVQLGNPLQGLESGPGER